MAKLFCSEGPFTFQNAKNREREARMQVARWNSGEKLRYAIIVFYFFQEGHRGAEGKDKERKWEFFRLLSMFVQSKNPNQCRIFHKRVVENYGSLQRLFEYILIIYEDFQQTVKREEGNISQMLRSLARECVLRRQQMQENTNKNIVQNLDVTSFVANSSCLSGQVVKSQLPTDINYCQSSEDNDKRGMNEVIHSILMTQ